MEDQTETFAKKLGDENLDQSITSISLLEPAAPMHSQASALQKSINFTILIPLIKKSQLLYHGYFHV